MSNRGQTGTSVREQAVSTHANGRTRTLTTKPLSVKQRGERATLSLRQALDLPIMPGDATAFGAALAEIAAEESTRNPRFADALRDRYCELMTQQPASRRRPASPKQELPPLLPIRRIEGYRANPFSPPDPRFLTHLYGSHQLDRALQDYTLYMLKETAAKVQQEHPGTKPRNKSSKQAVIDYIVELS